MNKGGQAWGFDLIIAIAIFIFGIIVFFLYSANYPKGEQEKVDNLLYEANSIAEDLMSDGNPQNWTISTVSKVGLLTANVINQSKLDQFYQLSQADYPLTRALFSTKYHYFINASSPLQVLGSSIAGIGLQPLNAKNSIKVS